MSLIPYYYHTEMNINFKCRQMRSKRSYRIHITNKTHASKQDFEALVKQSGPIIVEIHWSEIEPNGSNIQYPIEV